MTKLRVALLTPLTGSLQLYGKTCATALTLWAKKATNLPTHFTGVDLDIQDCGENLQVALQTALARRPDAIFGPYGSGPMLALARSCRRLLWNHGGASSRLVAPSFPHVINILSPASTYFAEVLQAIHASHTKARTIALVHSTTAFGREVAAGAKHEAARLQMTLHEIPFEASHTPDIVHAVPDADILLVAGNFADEQALVPLLLSRKWQYAACVGAGVEEVLASLGELREGLIGPAQWVAHTAPSPDEGPDAQWFVNQYRQEEGNDPPYTAAQAFAAGIVYARCLREAGDPREEIIRTRAHQLTCQTLFGRFQLDQHGLQTGHRVLVVQWQQGQRRVVWPLEQAERPLIYPPST